MDNFDENPFQNPFEDTSVNEARSGTVEPPKQEQLHDFNPFSSDNENKDASQLPAVIEPSESTSAPVTTTTSYQQQNEAAQDVLKKQQEELEKKAQELEEREHRTHQGIVVEKKNFPPLPLCCPIQPCFSQDINMDIPQRFQAIVRQHFIAWIAFSCTMALNLIAALSNLIAKSTQTSGTTFGLSILYILIFPPLVYVFCFRTVYKAFRNDSSINFFAYFLSFFIHNCIMVLWCIGIPGSGGVGFISGIATASGVNSGVGVFMVVVGVLFALNAAVGFILMIKVLRYYRNTDASFERAQGEFASGMNNGIRQAATAGVVNSFAETPSSNNRY